MITIQLFHIYAIETKKTTHFSYFVYGKCRFHFAYFGFKAEFKAKVSLLSSLIDPLCNLNESIQASVVFL